MEKYDILKMQYYDVLKEIAVKKFSFEFIMKKLDGSGKRRFFLILIDVILFFAVDVFYYLLATRAANSMPVDNTIVFLGNSLIHWTLILMFRVWFGTYNNVWRYANTRAYFNLVIADAAGGIVSLIVIRLLNIPFTGFYNGMWQAANVGSMTALLTLLSRYVYCLLYTSSSRSKKKMGAPVAIAGAGRLGTYLVGDLRNNPNSEFQPMFFIDTDGTKVGNTVVGLKVYNEETAAHLIKNLEIREVIIAITKKNSEEMAKLYRSYQQLGCKVRVYESLVENSAQNKGVLREFSIEDLLFRKELEVVDETTFHYYEGKTVLVTGGGGSIGSEICRQIAKCRPKKLVVFDIYENNAYDIQQEMLRIYKGELNFAAEIGSVRDEERLRELFETHRPNVVFHAAAHKHVPLMESCAAEAIKNNCLGTYNTANVAEEFGVEKFILISTDKAVNPTNVMGASKRICEMIVQSRSDSSTSFAAVRFGNVLGSNGSVIPLFQRQIAEGGPVTITDKRIIRYFMTIPEASQLVIQAGAMAERGELFVLDMGKPVKIYDLAVNMIQLSGLTPGKDIQIQEIGLRPGEKLYEELLIHSEDMQKTANNLIFIEHDKPYTRGEMDRMLAYLTASIANPAGIKEAMAQMVPTYQDADQVNQRAETSEEMKMAAES